MAFAEGRSDDIHYLRDGNREDVLEELDHETIDRIAHRLYAEESEHLSAYERLLKDDKRKKMEYLNNIRPDIIPNNRESHHREEAHKDLSYHGEDHVQDGHRRYSNEATPVDQLDQMLRRTDETH